jgi:hypothetical protein
MRDGISHFTTEVVKKCPAGSLLSHILAIPAYKYAPFIFVREYDIFFILDFHVHYQLKII